MTPEMYDKHVDLLTSLYCSLIPGQFADIQAHQDVSAQYRATHWILIEPETTYFSGRCHITTTNTMAMAKSAARDSCMRTFHHSPAHDRLQPRPITSSPVGSPKRLEPHLRSTPTVPGRAVRHSITPASDGYDGP